ncbi:hypothetical protein [Cohnella sp. REN36]|uniref:hypothetical protein n=1 Tax=Cohnella sp. REN36 TaxID=2887347 RepID=UPI001D137138|nr:hypothetical protein [Cohnella sp. REN36]MCC3376253.1 hypothetical protein [Cohnella sp. REN36]
MLSILYQRYKLIFWPLLAAAFVLGAYSKHRSGLDWQAVVNLVGASVSLAVFVIVLIRILLRK